jgi:hypothetical protein
MAQPCRRFAHGGPPRDFLPVMDFCLALFRWFATLRSTP